MADTLRAAPAGPFVAYAPAAKGAMLTTIGSRAEVRADVNEADPLRSLQVEPDPEAVHDVRAFVQKCCEDWDLPASSDVAVLLASELATNAVRYARTPLTVWLGHRSDRLVLSVEDASVSLATARTPDVWEEGGRGLQLVDALADRWGEREVAGGKLVWAEIAIRPGGETPTAD